MKINRLIFFLISTLLIGCSGKQETIMLVCEGTQTTRGGDGKLVFPVETKKVRKTFKINQDKKELINGSIDVVNDKSELKKDKKTVYTISVDNGAEFYERNLQMVFKDHTESTFESVNVDDTEIRGIKKVSTNSQSKEGDKYDDYSVTINRISGEFRDSKIENYKGKLHYSYITNTVGICKKVDKQF